jgi:hypothetical protein
MRRLVGSMLESEREGRGEEMHTKLRAVNLKLRNRLEDLGVN